MIERLMLSAVAMVVLYVIALALGVPWFIYFPVLFATTFFIGWVGHKKVKR